MLFSAATLSAIVGLRQAVGHVQQQARRCCAQHEVKTDLLASDGQDWLSIFLTDSIDARLKLNLHALRTQLTRQFIEKSLEAAHVCSEFERALYDPRPHEGHRHLIVLLGEFTDQQRLEEFLVSFPPHPAAQPLIGGDALEWLPARREFDVHGRQPHAQC